MVRGPFSSLWVGSDESLTRAVAGTQGTFQKKTDRVWRRRRGIIGDGALEKES